MSHQRFEDFDMTGISLLNIRASWDVENTGDARGVAALKMTLIEEKSFFADTEWWQWTPLGSEGGPGTTIDLVADETKFSIGQQGSGMANVPAGGRATIRNGAQLPGPALLGGLEQFWEKHSGASFKIVLELIWLTGSSFNESKESLGSHTYPNVIKLLKSATTAPTPEIASLGAVGQPLLEISGS